MNADRLNRPRSLWVTAAGPFPTDQDFGGHQPQFSEPACGNLARASLDGIPKADATGLLGSEKSKDEAPT